MRFILIVALCNVSGIRALFDITDFDFGSLHIHAKHGRLPLKYYPLSEQDQVVSEKAADVVDFIQLVPNLDPLQIALLEPLGIDLPSLWFKGKIYMKNFVLVGVKRINVRSVELRMNTLRTDLNVSFPNIIVQGDFNLQASISYLPIRLRCHVGLQLTNMDVSVASGIKAIQAPPIGEVLQVDSSEVQVSIENIRINMTNFVLGGDEGEVTMAIAQLFATPAHENLYDSLLGSALTMINNELIKVSSDVFKSYLFSAN